jgi:hypothetical protein
MFISEMSEINYRSVSQEANGSPKNRIAFLLNTSERICRFRPAEYIRAALDTTCKLYTQYPAHRIFLDWITLKNHETTTFWKSVYVTNLCCTCLS